MELPVYKMVLDPEDPELGMKLMSMVESPAIMINWVKFKDHKQIKFEIQSEEQRIVLAPGLVPGLPIYRNIEGKEFYLTIDAPTILETAIKFQKDHIATKLDTNHNSELLSGITIFETFVTNEKRVKSVTGFEDLPIGTWFLSAKVNNDQVWQKIKSGELNGFSIDALFKFKKAPSITDKELEGAIQEILNT